jgi:hypothetical protein
MEIWKKIEGFENYSVSSEGRVRHDKNDNLKKPGITNKGYLTINFMATKFNNRKCPKIHRLVAQAFLPNPNNYKEVNHLNGIKTDNRVENLEWCSGSQNVKHSFQIGLQKGKKGTENNFCVLAEYEVLEIRKLYLQGISQNEICKLYNKCYGTINKIVNRKSWTHI